MACTCLSGLRAAPAATRAARANGFTRQSMNTGNNGPSRAPRWNPYVKIEADERQLEGRPTFEANQPPRIQWSVVPGKPETARRNDYRDVDSALNNICPPNCTV